MHSAFQGHFEWFVAILVDNRTLNVKNDSKMRFVKKKTPDVNGLNQSE